MRFIDRKYLFVHCALRYVEISALMAVTYVLVGFFGAVDWFVGSGGPWLHLRSSPEWAARCWVCLLSAGRNLSSIYIQILFQKNCILNTCR